MGAKNRGYMKIQCQDCGRYIGRNNYESLHLPKCEPRQQRLELERTDRIHNAPIEMLNMKDAEEAGRWQEFVDFINTNTK